jgi:hypothetical protein
MLCNEKNQTAWLDMHPPDSSSLRSVLLAGRLDCSVPEVSEHFGDFPKINLPFTHNVDPGTIFHYLVVSRANRWANQIASVGENKNDEQKLASDVVRDSAKNNLSRLVQHLKDGKPFSVFINPRFSQRSKWLAWKVRCHDDPLGTPNG